MTWTENPGTRIKNIIKNRNNCAVRPDTPQHTLYANQAKIAGGRTMTTSKCSITAGGVIRIWEMSAPNNLRQYGLRKKSLKKLPTFT